MTKCILLNFFYIRRGEVCVVWIRGFFVYLHEIKYYFWIWFKAYYNYKIFLKVLISKDVQNVLSTKHTMMTVVIILIVILTKNHPWERIYCNQVNYILPEDLTKWIIYIDKLQCISQNYCVCLLLLIWRGKC